MDRQLPSQCGSTKYCLSRSVPEIHWHVAGTLSYQQPTNQPVTSLRYELSPALTLKLSGRNLVQITCNTFGAYHSKSIGLFFDGLLYSEEDGNGAFELSLFFFKTIVVLHINAHCQWTRNPRFCLVCICKLKSTHYWRLFT